MQRIFSLKLQKPKLTPIITIKKTKEEETLEEIKRKVSHCLVSDKTIQTNKIFERKNKDEIVISVHDNHSVDKAVEILNSYLAESCIVIIEDVNKPKLKIVDIQNLDIMDDKQLEEDINKRSFSSCNDECTILHTYVI